VFWRQESTVSSRMTPASLRIRLSRSLRRFLLLMAVFAALGVPLAHAQETTTDATTTDATTTGGSTRKGSRLRRRSSRTA
jgi:hypothetical protein